LVTEIGDNDDDDGRGGGGGDVDDDHCTWLVSSRDLLRCHGNWIT